MLIWAVPVVAFFLTLLLVPLVRKAALHFGIVAQPGGRHPHKTPTPLAGGAAIYVAVWTALALGVHPWDERMWGIFVGSALLFVLCLVDDARGLPVLPRFLGQILVAVIAWQHGVQIVGVMGHAHLAHFSVARLSAPLTIIWIVFMINAVNWIDGLDGLAAGVMGIVSLTLSIMGFSAGNLLVGACTAALAAGCAAFLFFNFNPARIFMGDSGSMFLGYMVACLSVLGVSKSAALVAVAVPLVALGIPIYDTLSTMLGRLWRGQPVYSADRSHLHHRLLDRGLTVRQTVLVIYGLTAGLCLIALGMWWR